ncbi:UNVERIFIED_CONTAM: hypothetical protein K2H54_054454 [Gekko kuhli]
MDQDFQYILCLGDIVWIPSVKAELESQLGFEKIYIERILNSTVMLNKHRSVGKSHWRKASIIRKPWGRSLIMQRDEGEEAEFCLSRTAKQRDRHKGLGQHNQYGGNTWERI